jgi:hypothetical protein
MGRSAFWYFLSLAFGLAACRQAPQQPACADMLHQQKAVLSQEITALTSAQAVLSMRVDSLLLRHALLSDSVAVLQQQADARQQLQQLTRPARDGAIRPVDTTQRRNNR